MEQSSLAIEPIEVKDKSVIWRDRWDMELGAVARDKTWSSRYVTINHADLARHCTFFLIPVVQTSSRTPHIKPTCRFFVMAIPRQFLSVPRGDRGESHDQLVRHLADFVAAYNFARRPKTLNGLSPLRRNLGVWLVGQVSPTARQLGPGLGLTVPPPAILVPLMSQIAVWPLML
jgi:hypothetical protein